MLEILSSHAASNFHFLFLFLFHFLFLFTREESWLLYAYMSICLYVYHIRTMWTLCPENVDLVQRTSNLAKKTMVTVFFNGTGLHMFDILPQNQKTDAEHFAQHIVLSLVSICYPIGRSCQCSDPQFKSDH
jgi:hypothetical protein